MFLIFEFIIQILYDHLTDPLINYFIFAKRGYQKHMRVTLETCILAPAKFDHGAILAPAEMKPYRSFIDCVMCMVNW